MTNERGGAGMRPVPVLWHGMSVTNSSPKFIGR